MPSYGGGSIYFSKFPWIHGNVLFLLSRLGNGDCSRKFLKAIFKVLFLWRYRVFKGTIAWDCFLDILWSNLWKSADKSFLLDVVFVLWSHQQVLNNFDYCSSILNKVNIHPRKIVPNFCTKIIISSYCPFKPCSRGGHKKRSSEKQAKMLRGFDGCKRLGLFPLRQDTLWMGSLASRGQDIRGRFPLFPT